MNRKQAPIAVFAYDRPLHLESCLNSLASNSEAHASDVLIFCDGPRGDHDQDQVSRVRSRARAARGFRSVEIIERDRNFGLSRSVITGVSEVLSAHDSIVVVEDDLVVSPMFLSYVNSGLMMYDDEPGVASIHGFMYQTKAKLPQSFFIRGADCWGWGTWGRAWSHFIPDAQVLLQRIDDSGESQKFDFNDAFPYRRMLVDHINGSVDSWAVRWYASAFLNEMLTLYPGRSLVANLGMEGSGTHQGSHAALMSSLGEFELPLRKIDVEESVTARQAIEAAFSERNSRVGRLRKILRNRITS